MNENVNGTGVANRPVRISSIRNPTVLVWLFDTKNLPAVGDRNYVHTNLHNGGAQFTFLDGHVVRFRNTEYWNFTNNTPRTNNPNIVWVP